MIKYLLLLFILSLYSCNLKNQPDIIVEVKYFDSEYYDQIEKIKIYFDNSNIFEISKIVENGFTTQTIFKYLSDKHLLINQKTYFEDNSIHSFVDVDIVYDKKSYLINQKSKYSFTRFEHIDDSIQIMYLYNSPHLVEEYYYGGIWFNIPNKNIELRLDGLYKPRDSQSRKLKIVEIDRTNFIFTLDGKRKAEINIKGVHKSFIVAKITSANTVLTFAP